MIQASLLAPRLDPSPVQNVLDAFASNPRDAIQSLLETLEVYEAEIESLTVQLEAITANVSKGFIRAAPASTDGNI